MGDGLNGGGGTACEVVAILTGRRPGQLYRSCHRRTGSGGQCRNGIRCRDGSGLDCRRVDRPSFRLGFGGR